MFKLKEGKLSGMIHEVMSEETSRTISVHDKVITKDQAEIIMENIDSIIKNCNLYNQSPNKEQSRIQMLS